VQFAAGVTGGAVFGGVWLNATVETDTTAKNAAFLMITPRPSGRTVGVRVAMVISI
jgi:hypothetical protein